MTFDNQTSTNLTLRVICIGPMHISLTMQREELSSRFAVGVGIKMQIIKSDSLICHSFALPGIEDTCW